MEIIKHALVTGGAKRIGAAITRGLALDGWPVGIHYHPASVIVWTGPGAQEQLLR